MSETLIVVPARLGSTRLGRKLLLDIHGKPVIYWTAKRISESGVADFVVATDSEEIADVCSGFSIPFTMTSTCCENGTERVFEVAARYKNKFKYFMNVQGDEPLIHEKIIRDIADSAGKHKDAFVTAISMVDNSEENDPSEVKVALSDDSRIRYASRCLVPYNRDCATGARWKIHGVYLYSYEVLKKFSDAPVGILESTEKVEQLRCIENDIPLIGIKTCAGARSVDTLEDLTAFRAMPYSAFTRGACTT